MSTETTRPNLRSFGENGSRIWYREDDTERTDPLLRVRRVKTRIGDDAKVQGPFKLAATKMTVEQVHDNQDKAEQIFELVNRPGVLINIDGQISASAHGAEIVVATVDKTKEKVVDKTTVEREITALGLWSRVGDKRASTQVYTNITVADAIKRVLEAIDIPYGDIEATPSAVLNYFWLSDQDDPVDVLTGLVDAAGHRARIDDYEGLITFSGESTGDRLNIYGGTEIDGWSAATTTLKGRTNEMSGSGGPTGISTVPNSFLWENGVWEPFQAAPRHIYDSDNDLNTWLYAPYSIFEYNDITYCIEQLRSGYDSDNNRYYIEALIVSEDNNDEFDEETFNDESESTMYLNFVVGNGESTGNRPKILHREFAPSSTTWNDLNGRTGALTSMVRTATSNGQMWLFSSSEIVQTTQHRGRYRIEVTKDIAEETGVIRFTLTTDDGTYLDYIEFDGQSQKLIFSDWQRNDDDSRYFNSVAATSVTRVLDASDADLWASPEDIEVAANASLTIRVSSDDGTPFVLANSNALTYTANTNLESITTNRTSGSEIDVTITAGSSALTLENLKVRGRYYVIGSERVVRQQDNGAIRDDGEIEYELPSAFPVDLELDYVESWTEARLQVGLERRWTTTLDMYGYDPGEDGYVRNNWQTMMRLRPGRLVRILHERAEWLGVIREIERESGAKVDHVDRYRVTCELTSVADFDPDILRIGLDNYGSDKVLG